MRSAIRIWAWTAIILLNAPIVVVAIMSVSAGAYLSFPPTGLSLQWYGSYFHSPRWMLATANSLRLAVATVALATPIGVLGSFGLMRGRFRFRRLTLLLVNTPLLLPGVVAAIGMYFFFARLGMIGSFWSILRSNAGAGGRRPRGQPVAQLLVGYAAADPAGHSHRHAVRLPALLR